MRQAASKFLFSYWNNLRKERATPMCGQIDPVALNPQIGHVFMLRCEADNTLNFALAGRQCEAVVGRPLRGLAFTSLWDDSHAREISQLCFRVAVGSLPVVIGASVQPEGYAPEGLELLLLPLRQIGGEPGMILGSMALPPEVRWLGLRACQPFNLISHRFLTCDATSKVHSSYARQQREHKSRQIMPLSPSLSLRRAHLAVYEGGLALKSRQELP